MKVEFRSHIASPAQVDKWTNGHANASIPGYLINFAGGRTATPESEFLSNLGYDTEMVALAARGIIADHKSRYPRLMAYDLSRLETKYGPQGWIYPLGDPDMIAKINAYYTRCHNPCKPSRKALKTLLDFANSAGLKPYTFEEVITRSLEKTQLSSNSGLPLFAKRSKVIPDTVRLARDCMQTGATYPAVIGARSIKNKLRLIFMAPFEQNLRELAYVYPVMDYLLAHTPYVNGWRGPKPVADSINETFLGGKVTLLSTDFVGMDQTVGPAQLSVFATILAAFFQPQYRDEIKQLINQSTTQEVLVGAMTSPGTAQGSRRQKRILYLNGTHGLFSGLGFTNLSETLLQILLDIDLTYSLPIFATEVNGDDGIKAIDGHRNLDHVADVFVETARKYGFEANAEKQFVSYDELHYLQRIYSPETEWDGYVHGAYPISQTLNSAKNPERLKMLTEVEQAVRLLMIFENLEGSPIRDSGAEILVAGCPYLQQWIETGTGAKGLAEGYSRLVNSGEYGSNLAEKSAIDELWIVKTLRNNSALLDAARSHYRSVM